jgi:hypothetical protein
MMANESPAVTVPNFSALLGALQAVKNVRAVILTALVLVTTAIVFAAVVFVVGRANSVVLTLIGALFAYLVAIYGVSAVGFMLMNEAKGAPPLSIADALTVSMMSTHRWIVVMLLALVVFILFAVVLALIFFVCKIPFAGPVLYAVVVPVATFVTAFFLAAMYFVVTPLAFPSVWCGDGVMQVVSKLTAIARQRLVAVVVRVIVLMLLCFFVTGIIASLVFSAMAIVGGMSAGILGVGGGIGALTGGMGRMMGGMDGSTGYMIAGGIGFAIVMAVVLIVPFLMAIQGYCVIYLDVTKDMDFSAAEAGFKSRLEDLQRQAREAQERVREKTQAQPAPPAAAPAPAPAAARPAPPPPAPAATQCPKCSGPIASDDAFCGGCGYKLR